MSQAHRQFQPPARPVSEPNKYDAKNMTRTHFLLGNEKNLGVTTANASYQAPPQDYQRSILDEKTKGDLRQSHFNLGGDAGRYLTTNKRDYVPKEGSAAERNAQEERKAKMRGHNFNFGKEGNNFVSTNNAAYQNYSGQGIANMTNNNSSNIRKTHFTLGGENAPMRTVHQMEYVEKSGITAGKTKDSIAFQCTNFKFGDDNINHISSSHMHYKYYPSGQSGKLNREQLNELRKEHFILGKHPSQYKSVTHMAHDEKGMARQDALGSRKAFQASSVRLGDPELSKTFFQTTYEVANQAKPLGGNTYQHDNIAKQGSHFQIGDSRGFIGKTQHQATYIPLDYSKSAADKELERNIKGSHFDLGMGPALPGQYKSVMQAAHDFKGNASEIRSKLDQQRKEDLTASHFKVGADKVRMKSTMQGSYVDMGPSKSAFNDDKKRDLRNSHFLLGDPSNADYKTSNEINYRWVQPREAKG